MKLTKMETDRLVDLGYVIKRTPDEDKELDELRTRAALHGVEGTVPAFDPVTRRAVDPGPLTKRITRMRGRI